MKNILTESEKNEILEMHRKHGYNNFINEGEYLENISLREVKFNVYSQISPGEVKNPILRGQTFAKEEQVILHIKPGRFEPYETIIVDVSGGLNIETVEITDDPSTKVSLEYMAGTHRIMFKLTAELMDKLSNNMLNIEFTGNIEGVTGYITLDFKGSAVKG